MATNFPGSLDTSVELPNPTGANTLNSPDHAGLHSNENGAIIAVETKLGTGSSAASSGTVLRGTGSGATSYGQVNVTTDVASFTSANLRTLLSDETGSGAAVFATTPTLVTPAVDTINESTPANGVTIDGLNIKDNKLNTNNSVVTANITNASVTADKLATGAAVATVATLQTTTSTSYTDLATAGPAVTVTIGANGMALVAIGGSEKNSGANFSFISYAISGASTVAASDNVAFGGVHTAENIGTKTILVTGLTAGSNTFTAKYSVSAGTGTFERRTISVIPL